MTARPTCEPESAGPVPGLPWPTWFAAAAAAPVDGALRLVYARLDRAIERRGAVCRTSGRCCRFDSFGHRLYVTGLEIAWVLTQVRPARAAAPPTATGGGSPAPSLAVLGPADLGRPRPGGACPFQAGSLCSVHRVRPLGCRVFFCDVGVETWQHRVYERCQVRLRRLHDRHAIPYAYMEWRGGLAAATAALSAG